MEYTKLFMRYVYRMECTHENNARKWIAGKMNSMHLGIYFIC